MTEQQMEREADNIRRNWTAPAPPASTPAEAYIQDVTAERPLGPGDVGMLQALGHYGTSPLFMSRDQKLERKQLIQHLKHRDPTGLSGPDTEALNRHPDLLALWRGLADDDSSVRDSAQREISERTNPRPHLDPVMTAACQRIAAAARFQPKKAPRS